MVADLDEFKATETLVEAATGASKSTQNILKTLWDFSRPHTMVSEGGVGWAEVRRDEQILCRRCHVMYVAARPIRAWGAIVGHPRRMDDDNSIPLSER